MFHVWIVVALPFDENKFVTRLKDKRYDVSAAAENNQLLIAVDGSKSGVMACRVERELVNTKEVYDDVAELLNQHRIEYYSLVISEFSANSMWDAGNILNDKLLPFSMLKDTKNNIN